MPINGTRIVKPVNARQDVGALIGLPSGNVGELICRAKTGGKTATVETYDSNGNPVTQTYPVAYDIKETQQGGFYGGAQLEGAEPYHNIYSKGPTHWEIREKTSGSGSALRVMEVFNVLNKDAIVASFAQHYSFNLHDFDGYDHSATPPRLRQENITNLGYVGSLPSRATVQAIVDLGSIDWLRMFQDGGFGWLTQPYIGVYRIEYNGTNIHNPGWGEGETVPLEYSGENRIAVFISTMYFTTPGRKALQLELKIGQTDALHEGFRLDKWFKGTVYADIKSRPSVSSGLSRYWRNEGGDWERVDDATVFMYENYSALLMQKAGGSWNGSEPYTGVMLSGGGTATTFAASVSVEFYAVINGAGDGEEIMRKGYRVGGASFQFGSKSSFSIAYNYGNIQFWDSDTVYVYAMITNITWQEDL